MIPSIAMLNAAGRAALARSALALLTGVCPGVCLGVAADAQPGTSNNLKEVTVTRMHKGAQSFSKVDADGFAAASPQQVWQVLTDYEKLPDFVPNLVSSKVSARDAAGLTLEQHGTAGFLFITRDVHLVVRVTERPFATIEIGLIRGDMKRYVARWDLIPVTQGGIKGTRIVYSAEMEPDFFVPPLINGALMQTDIQRMMEAVLAEIARRY